MNVTINSMVIVLLVSVIFQQTRATNFEEIEIDEQPADCRDKSKIQYHFLMLLLSH